MEKKKKHTETFTNDPHTLIAETILTQNDLDRPNGLWDNGLYYVSGFLVKSLLARVQCVTCRAELLLDPKDCHAYKMYNMYPVYAKFTTFKQQGGLVFPFANVLKIVKATEVIFRRRVIEQGIGISTDINLFGRIQSAVLEQYGPYVFYCSTSHFYEHSFGAERDHLSSLVKAVSEKYLNLRMTTYTKRFSQMVIHKNVPSTRHLMTREILFQNLQIMNDYLVLYIHLCNFDGYVSLYIFSCEFDR